MPDIDATEAVRLAAEALYPSFMWCDASNECHDECGRVAFDTATERAAAAVTAALPALAEQFAALIEAARHPHGYHRVGMAPEDAAEWCALCDRMTHAARLVREAAEVTG